MNNEIRELSRDELDLVSGGTIVNRIGDAITNAITNAVGAGIDWLRANIPADIQYNTTGRGDNSGCTGNKC